MSLCNYIFCPTSMIRITDDKLIEKVNKDAKVESGRQEK